ncbi:glycosyltransferase [Catalinimonas niigatensis]|uniref:glycosyltransferase n=1 Tax=Catalinimonas niigatensis TaxID=1397264 RepID=UPI002665AFA1|nr:glycosyltransferase [Catalinimonas niigatensis]WPP53189.1 glycosyltransferase [Catalinimonas niigatensis]
MIETGIIFLVTLTASTILADVLLLLFWKFNFRSYWSENISEKLQKAHPEINPMPPPELKEIPKVAVLLAVRNEEALLPACLESLLSSAYPAEKLSIWIGNDASEDQTLAIAQAFQRKDARVRVVDVKVQVGQAQAKANVLAHLVQTVAQDANPPKLLLVTDADVQVQTHWVGGMVQSWQAKPKKQEIGVVTGITLVDGSTAWGQLQRIDWIFALGMVKVASDWGIPIATMGNNMMMYLPAYRATGGYEHLPFSITEDFQILHEITKQGYSFRNVVAPQVVAFTQPMTSWNELLQQRKRWMHGAVKLPLPIVSILFLQATFFPLIIFLLFYQPLLGLGLWISKGMIQSFFIMQVTRKLTLSRKYRKRLYRYLLLYDLYAAILTPLTVGIYLLPIKTSWKGRRY